MNCGYDGVASHCIVTNTSANAAQRVPILGETQTALLTSEFTGASWYHSMQATLRKQMSKGLTFQAAYTFSKSENNMTVLNDQNDLALDKARAAFDRTHRLIANFDYQLPLPGRYHATATCTDARLVADRYRAGAKRPADDADRSERRHGVRPRRDVDHHDVPRRNVRVAGHQR